MPKIFSHFRRFFLSENKFSKYLIYAVGEIVLLVIGILLALQINTWNNSQTDRQKELAYIKSFLSDLEKDRKDLDRFIEDALEIADELEILMDLSNLDLTQPDNTDTLHMQFRKAVRLRTWSHHDRTLNQLESNADYILLKPAVADSIAIFKQLVKKLKQQEGGCSTIYRKNLDVANQYLHRHLIRYSSEEYLTRQGELTGKHLPPIPEDPILHTSLFNQAATYQGCLLYYVHELARPLMEDIVVLDQFLRAEYNIPTSR